VFFRRKSAPDAAIADFWQWWPTARPRLTASIDAREGGMSMVDEIRQRVHAIDPDLEWELGQGEQAKNAFVLTPAGNAKLRATAARWRAAAPPADEIWEFHDARQPSAGFDDFTLQIGEHSLAMSEVRFGAILTGDEPHSVDVTVFHPLFADLPDNLRSQITFLALDWALGENGVETWVGLVEPMATEPPDARTVHELRAVVTEIADRHRKPVWAILGAETPEGQPVMAMTQLPLRAVRWPRFDTHVGVVLPYAARDNGLPTDEALQALRLFEDQLEPVLAKDGELLAHETQLGQRTLHYYVDGETQLPARIREAVKGWPRGAALAAPDPELRQVSHLSA
jgi:hypothetical protein